MALGVTPQEIIDRNQYPLLSKAEDWKRIQLSEVATIQNGYAFKSSFFDREEGVPLIRIRDITKSSTEHKYKGEYNSEYVVKNGDILIGMDGDFTVARWKGQDALLNQRVCRIKLINKSFDEKFLFICLQPYLDAIHAETSSVTVKHLSSRTISEIPLPFPPIQEQKDIVTKVEQLFCELDNGIESLKTAREQLKTYRQSLLKHAFEGKLTEQWRKENADKLETPEQLLARIQQERQARYQQQLEEWKQAVKEWEISGRKGKKPGKPSKPTRIIQATDEEFRPLPTGWLWIEYASICEQVRNGISAKPSGNSGEKIFRISAVRAMEFNLDDIRYLQDTDGQYREYFLSKGDLVFTRYNGTKDYVGVCAEYKGDGTHLYPDKLIQTRIAVASVIPSYMEKAINSGCSRKFMEKRIRTTAGQSGISGSDIKQMPVPLCCKDEQAIIELHLERQLSNINAINEDIDFGIRKAEVLRQSILKKAFSGQLVPQDLTGEPINELLARLQNERVAIKIQNSKKTRGAK